MVGWEASLGCGCLSVLPWFCSLSFPSYLFLFLLHFLPCLQLVIGRFAVSLASVFVRYRQGEWRPGKKTGFGVTFTHVSDTYHLLHQINMASECVGVGVGVCVYEYEPNVSICVHISPSFRDFPSPPPITLSPLPLGTGGANLHGMGFYLALNALNFAEADRPFRKLCNEQQLSEMFFSLGLQCHFSLPYGSTLPMV